MSEKYIVLFWTGKGTYNYCDYNYKGDSMEECKTWVVEMIREMDPGETYGYAIARVLEYKDG